MQCNPQFAPLTSLDLEATPLSSLVALYRLHIHPKPAIDLSEYPSDTRYAFCTLFLCC